MLNRFKRIARLLIAGPKPSKRAQRHGVSRQIPIPLRIWVFQDGSKTVAQGLEIDYVACGDTKEAAIEHFARGLLATVEAHIEEFGTAERFLKPAPPQIWAEFIRAVRAARDEMFVDEPRPLPGASLQPIREPLLESMQTFEPRRAVACHA